MANDGAGLIDRSLVVALCADFDPDTISLLMHAAENDLIEWSERLVEAWLAVDPEACHRARHSLKGVCTNFGATALLALSAEDLSGQAAIARLRECRNATILALRAAVGC